MDTAHAAWLALLQGITEFLPISSDAHLILVPRLLGWPDQGLAFDAAVHLGTLAAVIAYFRRELMRMARDWLATLVGGRATPDARLAWAVLFGTIPAGLAGLLLHKMVEGQLRTPLVIATATLAFGLLLGWADRRGGGPRNEHQLTWRDVAVIGCAQALALIPGTSRSGITITAALFCGLDRTAAARYSFLLSIPIIAAAGALEVGPRLLAAPHGTLGLLALGVAISAVSAYLTIHFFLRLLQRIGMMPFVVYRLILGAVLLVLFL